MFLSFSAMLCAFLGGGEGDNAGLRILVESKIQIVFFSLGQVKVEDNNIIANNNRSYYLYYGQCSIDTPSSVMGRWKEGCTE
jgi:hypothetical protein